MGTVYLAETGEGERVALKVIRPDLADEPEFRRRFRGEVARAQDVPPFCTAEVLDADPDHQTPYLVVEFVDGPSLSEVVLDRGPLTPANLHGLAIGVATALTAIHSAGVIHRDLKPSNVLLAPGAPKVIDFGIARVASSQDSDTRTDQLIGTVAYMAPERLDPVKQRPLTPAADIFAWGAVVTFAATGRVPFVAESSPATAVAILTREPDLAGLTEPLRALVDRALAKDPAARPTARELLDALLSTAPRRSGQQSATANPAGPGKQGGIADQAGKQAGHADQAGKPAGNREQASDHHLTTGQAAARVTIPGPAGASNPAGTSDPAATSDPAGASNPAGTSGPDSGDLAAARETPPEPRPDADEPTRVGVPEDVIGTEVIPGETVPVPRRPGSRLRTFAVSALVLLVLGMAGTLAAIIHGDIRLRGVSGLHDPRSPVAAGSTSPSASADPFAGWTYFAESLAAPGKWPNRALNPVTGSSCTVHDGLSVTLSKVTTYRCPGMFTQYADFRARVNLTLMKPGSCGSIWFHFADNGDEPQGFALQVCADRVLLMRHYTVGGVSDTDRIGGEMITPLVVGTAYPVEIVQLGTHITVSIAGLPMVDTFSSYYPVGRLVLGIFQSPPVDQPRDGTPAADGYQVRFDHLEIWSPATFTPAPVMTPDAGRTQPAPTSAAPSPSASPTP